MRLQLQLLYLPAGSGGSAWGEHQQTSLDNKGCSSSLLRLPHVAAPAGDQQRVTRQIADRRADSELRMPSRACTTAPNTRASQLSSTLRACPLHSKALPGRHSPEVRVVDVAVDTEEPLQDVAHLQAQRRWHFSPRDRGKPRGARLPAFCSLDNLAKPAQLPSAWPACPPAFPNPAKLSKRSPWRQRWAGRSRRSAAGRWPDCPAAGQGGWYPVERGSHGHKGSRWQRERGAAPTFAVRCAGIVPHETGQRAVLVLHPVKQAPKHTTC